MYIVILQLIKKDKNLFRQASITETSFNFTLKIMEVKLTYTKQIKVSYITKIFVLKLMKFLYIFPRSCRNKDTTEVHYLSHRN